MASVDLVRPSVGTFLFYNLDAAVGKGGHNERADVLLVQYLLTQIIHLRNLSYLQNESVGGGGQISGVWDQHWDVLLHNYQNDLKHKGKAIGSMDGLIRSGRA
jgi:hypothetical protein